MSFIIPKSESYLALYVHTIIALILGTIAVFLMAKIFVHDSWLQK